MSEPDPGQLSLMEGEPDSGLPLIYVASPLSHLDEDGRRLVDAWCELISHAVVETTMQAEEQWPVRLHAPITWSVPWKGDGRSPNEVYQANIGLVMGAAALVLVGYRGGSLGAGPVATVTVTRVAQSQTAPATCRVPSLRGRTLAAAGTALRSAGCRVGPVRRVRSARVRTGRVVAQSSRAGLSVPLGSRVRLTVSKGRR